MIGVIGTRFIGRFVVEELVRAGEDVAVLARDPELTRTRVGKSVGLVPCDLESIPEALPSLTCVISTVPVQMANLVVDLASRAGVDRVIFLSSTWRHSVTKTDGVRRVVEGEEAILSSGLNWTVIRPSMVYGPGDRNISRLRDRITSRRVLPVIGSGSRLVQPVYVEDVAYAVSAAVARRSAECEDFDVCGPEPMTYTDMIDQVAQTVSRSPIKVYVPLSVARLLAWGLERFTTNPMITVDRVARMGEDREFPIDKAREALGFIPRTFSEGLRAYYN